MGAGLTIPYFHPAGTNPRNHGSAALVIFLLTFAEGQLWSGAAVSGVPPTETTDVSVGVKLIYHKRGSEGETECEASDRVMNPPYCRICLESMPPLLI